MITHLMGLLIAARAAVYIGAMENVAPASLSQLGSARILSAQGEAKKQTETELVVASLRDVGASMPKGADGRPIHERFTSAIRSHMAELAKDAYKVRERTLGEKRALHLRLEGELAHTDSDAEDGGGYLCTLRLYEDSKPRRLLGQWSGTAATLRDLTSNLRHDRKTSPLGLLGELGRRVDEAVRARREPDTPYLILQVLDRCSQSQNPEIALAINPGEEPKKSIVPKERYRVSIRSPLGGYVWLLSLPEVGTASLLLGDVDRGFSIPDGDRVVLPTRGVFTSPRREGVMTLIALVRQGEIEGKPGNTQPINTEKETGTVRGEDRDTVSVAQNAPPVAVVSTYTPPQELAWDVRWLLERVLSEPQGTWIAQALDIPVKLGR